MNVEHTRILVPLAVILALGVLLPGLRLKADQFSAWTGAIQALAVLGALAYAALQLSHGRSAAKVDRTLQLHEDFTSGEVGASRHRLSTFLYSSLAREREHVTKPNQSYQPRAHEIATGGSFRTYHQGDDEVDCPYITQDVDQILWFFQRVEGARLHKTVDENLLLALLGWHAIRWEVAFAHISDDDLAVRSGLTSFSRWVWYSGDQTRRADWTGRLQQAFPFVKLPTSLEQPK